MKNSKELKKKILDAADEVCNERYGVSFYEICGFSDSDADTLKEFLVSDSLQEVKAMGVSTFIASIPRLSELLLNGSSYRNRDRALRRLYDNKVIMQLIDRLNAYIDMESSSFAEASVNVIADRLAEDAVRLAEYANG